MSGAIRHAIVIRRVQVIAMLLIVGRNGMRLWGIAADARIERMASMLGLPLTDRPAEARIVADARFAFDIAWLRLIGGLDDTVLTLGGVPMLAHARCGEDVGAIAAAMEQGAPLPPHLAIMPIEQAGSIEDRALRKRERPFASRLTPASLRAAERAIYFGSYKGVTDLLTKYLWPEWALSLTRLAARVGLSPNGVTTIGLLFCIGAGVAFLRGEYWPGLAAGLVSMVLDTVDGKLARCTLTASRWGNLYDHGIDLIHPPLWWWAWSIGLARHGTPLRGHEAGVALAVIFGAYVVQRLIEGAFIARFGMHIHVWRPFDSRFRLVTARRNPNMLLLFACLCAGRPDLGLLALAWWSALCCVVHLARLGQAWIARRSGAGVESWLAG